jgi:hypothetical protein
VRHGDLSVGLEPAELGPRRRALVDRPWVWLHQVHGAGVVVVGDHDVPDDDAGSAADALVTARDDVALAVHTADCAGVALVADNGAVGAVHAGWRGLVAGVLPAAVGALRDLGAARVWAASGPCIGPECYEFGEAELAQVADRLGPTVRGETATGAPALDLRAGVRAALAEVDVTLEHVDPRCTACAGGDEPVLFSHRARRDVGRQAVVVWLDAHAAGGPPPFEREG